MLRLQIGLAGQLQPPLILADKVDYFQTDTDNMAIQIQRILLPTDFSSYSATATQYACALATQFDAELHLLHTLDAHLASAPGFAMGLALTQYVQESREAAEKALAGVINSPNGNNDPSGCIPRPAFTPTILSL